MEMRPITPAVDVATDEAISRLAAGRGITRDECAAACGAGGRELLAFAQVGIDAANRGEVIPHDVVIGELDAMIERHRSGIR